MFVALRTLALSAAFTLQPSDDAKEEFEPRTCVRSLEELTEDRSVDADDRRLHASHLIVVDKSDRRLMLFERGERTGCWPVGLGFSPTGHKNVEGDGKTPQGWYRTSDKPWSSFDHAIAIHYPNAIDAAAGVAAGRIRRPTRDRIVQALERGRVPPQRTALGGAILIHGGGSAWDWTLGCVALKDQHLLELREALPSSMRAHILIIP